MKKFAASILLLIYFTVTTGFVVSVHYCMGKLQSVELGYCGKTECGKCGMVLKQSKGCCKDDVTVVKVKADHNLVKTTSPDFSLSSLPLQHNDAFALASVLASQHERPVANGPPLGKQDTYLLNRVFRL